MHLLPPAYRVPFRFERRAPHLLRNISDETVYDVSLVLHGAGLLSFSPPATLQPGEGVRVAVRHHASATILIVQWFRYDGLEYVWRVSF